LLTLPHWLPFTGSFFVGLFVGVARVALTAGSHRASTVFLSVMTSASLT
jgi:hypothetical protein